MIVKKTTEAMNWQLFQVVDNKISLSTWLWVIAHMATYV